MRVIEVGRRVVASYQFLDKITFKSGIRIYKE